MGRPPRKRHVRVYLVPGFFGFDSLGALSYFNRVADVLGGALARRGCVAEIVECETQPTGAIPRRAARLLAQVIATGGLDADEIHFVGHSTGGLDVRLLLSPGVNVDTSGREDALARRTRSAISVATPHLGTPLASFFAESQGRKVLMLLAALATSTGGRAAVVAASRVLSAAARADDFLGRTDTFLDELSRDVLRGVSFRRDDPLWRFVREVATDQGAVVHLTPEGMNLFAATVVDHPRVAYGCVLAAAPQPPFAFRPRDVLRPQGLALAAAFVLLHTLTARTHTAYPLPDLEPELVARIEGGQGVRLGRRPNDGVVPTASQVHGPVLHAVLADHLDVVGQYPRDNEPMSDWLPSGAHFDRERFERLWDRIAETIAAHSGRDGAAAAGARRPRTGRLEPGSDGP